ncbi:hypothetical protein CMUS01_04235 [Colletotrichum musicola]|uniref:Uncharacterized protein n=1 Tax=Colletotrichum musicola TaxID=2175873 RepID=A0A8H6NNM9_9PEZI|nr:hypothetical protein CMUS01_04235 [Colletotrichum musicola]
MPPGATTAALLQVGPAGRLPSGNDSSVGSQISQPSWPIRCRPGFPHFLAGPLTLRCWDDDIIDDDRATANPCATPSVPSSSQDLISMIDDKLPDPRLLSSSRGDTQDVHSLNGLVGRSPKSLLAIYSPRFFLLSPAKATWHSIVPTSLPDGDYRLRVAKAGRGGLVRVCEACMPPARREMGTDTALPAAAAAAAAAAGTAVAAHVHDTPAFSGLAFVNHIPPPPPKAQSLASPSETLGPGLGETGEPQKTSRPPGPFI